ncbi:MAG: hypothetical protein ABH810_00530 [bacterium]
MKLIKDLGLKIGGATLAAGAWASVAFAQIGDIGILTPKSGTLGLRQTIYSVINVFLAIAGILAVVYLIYGGVLYITAGGDAEKAGKGRIAITNAIIGIVIILAALIIYNGVIETFTGSDLN